MKVQFVAFVAFVKHLEAKGGWVNFVILDIFITVISRHQVLAIFVWTTLTTEPIILSLVH